MADSAGTKPLLVALQNRHRRRVIVGVAQAEMKPHATALLEKLLSSVVQDDERLARFLPPHFHVLPAQLLADPRAERFGNGFFGREAGRQKRRREAVRQAIGDFPGPQNALQEALAEFFVGSAD